MVIGNYDHAENPRIAIDCIFCDSGGIKTLLGFSHPRNHEDSNAIAIPGLPTNQLVTPTA